MNAHAINIRAVSEEKWLEIAMDNIESRKLLKLTDRQFRVIALHTQARRQL